ncbi:hypothetical protein [Sphingomonas fuzhouensis]|uniref:hypothetical protein n=1 Tax=Sphingomonas fuzhouensis TaxID=3106033 RepID=UPI002AFE6651|nr:hypothetical protein [Sphingomonas sp. SGZ-02]
MVQDHASFENYRELTAMIDAGIEALSAARALLHRLEELPDALIDPELLKLFLSPPLIPTVSIQPLSRKLIAQEQRRLLVIERMAALMPRAGRNGVAILLRLLDEPGSYVSCEELVRAAGIRSVDGKAVKVYICNLRCALRLVGIPTSAIETGRRSYRLVQDSVAAIRSLVNGDAHSDDSPLIDASPRLRQVAATVST